MRLESPNTPRARAIVGSIAAGRFGKLATLALLAVALIAPRAARASKAEDILGEWTIRIQLPGDARIAHLKAGVNGNGDFEGTIQTPLGESDIDSFSLEGDDHIVSYKVEAGGRSMSFKLRLKIDGDALTGSGAVGENVPPTIPLRGAKAGTDKAKALEDEVERARMAKAGEPTLTVADAGALMGEWSMTVESQTSGTQVVDFLVKDFNGKASAILKMPLPMGEQIINKIAKTDKGWDLKYDANVMGNQFNITMGLALKDDKIAGSIADDNGVFEIPVSAVRKGSQPAVTGNSAAVDSALTGRAPRRSPNQPMGQATARGRVGGKEIVVSYGRLSTQTPGQNRIPWTADEGFIWPIGRDFATKMKTNAPLVVGDKTIPPGRYSLWAKKVGAGWHLVVNDRPDIWSTQHNPEGDVAETPFEASKAEKSADQLAVTIKDDHGQGQLTVAWGDDLLKATFRPGE